MVVGLINYRAIGEYVHRHDQFLNSHRILEVSLAGKELSQPLSAQTLFTGFEWLSALIGVIAFIALWRFKVGIITVIGACGLAGLAYTFARPLIGI